MGFLVVNIVRKQISRVKRGMTFRVPGHSSRKSSESWFCVVPAATVTVAQ
jgi:hypothetical protein